VPFIRTSDTRTGHRSLRCYRTGMINRPRRNVNIFEKTSNRGRQFRVDRFSLGDRLVPARVFALLSGPNRTLRPVTTGFDTRRHRVRCSRGKRSVVAHTPHPPTRERRAINRFLKRWFRFYGRCFLLFFILHVTCSNK
jgi:hypothetical protein